jgi:uncharacterized membrane protein
MKEESDALSIHRSSFSAFNACFIVPGVVFMRRFESFIEVEAPVELVFDLLADFESYPRWMGGVRDVRRTGRRTTHWVAETALDFDVEWDAETTHFEPDRRIVWRAFSGDVHADGEAVLSETERGATVVHYVLGYDTPAGRDGERVTPFFGEHPKRRLEKDLARFKRLAERTYRESRGDGRGFSSHPTGATRYEERASRYEEERGGDGAENFPARQRRARFDDRGRERHGEEFGEAVRPRRAVEDYGDDRGDYREHEEYGERPRVESFRERNIDRLMHGSRRDRDDGPEHYERERRETERGRSPYAMTPREREMERERRMERERSREERSERDRDSDWFERRGVDRLLEDPPSSRWRR